MGSNKPTSYYMRLIHRYLGFFLAGVMAVYAISGVVLVFRNTDFLKKEILEQKTIDAGLTIEKVGEALRLRGLKMDKQEGDVIFFNNGSYNVSSGEAEFTKKELPYVMGKLTHLHKANTNSPLYYFNIFFGVSLLFFVLSAFWMYMPSTDVFKKGIYFTLGGLVLTLILLFV